MAAKSIEPLTFEQVGRIPAPGDNVAIAVRTLAAGTRIFLRQIVFELSHTVLEGHRFVVHPIPKGGPLLSWGLPFGLASRDLEPGEYICNEKILRALAERHVDFDLPGAANFTDYRLPFTLEETKFRPGNQAPVVASRQTFQGFRRNEKRGAGTRNYIVVLGTTSRSAGFARALARQFESAPREFENVDGVVAVEHTEGGSASRPRNFELILRTLAGFMVHPNVGAVLAVDFGSGPLSNQVLREFLERRGYPVEGLLRDDLSISSSFEASLREARGRVESWLPIVNEFRRQPLPLSHLRLGLQCGGSDAFSGVSGNPLAGVLAREIVARGGSANLAETSELIGAESYVLRNVRDLETARAFLDRLDRFQAWAAEHGHSAEGNPSGGNMYRGLYNITIKSIGAARKKDPATRLDYVIDYGSLMDKPGFYFMDSPGNDLESIAGQVAAGCNLIIFTTGNGSITNFPFVPTIKIMNTTRRFELVRNEMDFNAGRHLDGETLEDLGREALDLMVKIASGRRSAGEKAGHAQVQLWREWRGGPEARDSRERASMPSNAKARTLAPLDGRAVDRAFQSRADRVALVLPTSLCSGQIARMIAERLNAETPRGFTRAVALPHTEGCGNCAGESERLFIRTMTGYLAHPFVARALLLEHGCEKTHNDAFRNALREFGMREEEYGFASVQLDGGIERVTAKALRWFRENGGTPPGHGLSSFGFAGKDAPGAVAEAIGALALAAKERGGAAVLSEETQLDFIQSVLAYGERFDKPGVYGMECPTSDLCEALTGLAATGVEVLLAYDSTTLVPGNPLVPTLQIADAARLPAALADDVDLVVEHDDSAESIAARLLEAIGRIRAGRSVPRSQALGNIAFQITRGYTGISL